MKELWKEIPGFRGYRVSNFGRVYSMGRIITVVDNTRWDSTYKKPIAPRFLVPSKHSAGYRTVGLGRTGKNHYVHDLVARAFIGERPIGMQINHVDGVKSNNVSTNLEYVTNRQNAEHARSRGLVAKCQHCGNYPWGKKK